MQLGNFWHAVQGAELCAPGWACSVGPGARGASAVLPFTVPSWSRSDKRQRHESELKSRPSMSSASLLAPEAAVGEQNRPQCSPSQCQAGLGAIKDRYTPSMSSAGLLAPQAAVGEQNRWVNRQPGHWTPCEHSYLGSGCSICWHTCAASFGRSC